MFRTFSPSDAGGRGEGGVESISEGRSVKRDIFKFLSGAAAAASFGHIFYAVATLRARSRSRSGEAANGASARCCSKQSSMGRSLPVLGTSPGTGIPSPADSAVDGRLEQSPQPSHRWRRVSRDRRRPANSTRSRADQPNRRPRALVGSAP